MLLLQTPRNSVGPKEDDICIGGCSIICITNLIDISEDMSLESSCEDEDRE